MTYAVPAATGKESKMHDDEALTPGFMVIHGNHLEALRELALTWMRRYPLHPLENEVLLVQSNGIAQWLKQALAEDRAGIAAAVQVELPARFLWQTYRNVLGSASIARQSPLDKAPLTWRLMRLLPGLLDEPCFAPLRRFLADDQDLRKRHQLAERLADLFDQYQVYRADWLQDWAAGRDQLHTSRQGIRPLDADSRWQAALWRALLADVGSAELAASRAGVHPRFIAQLAALQERPAGLPRRVLVFGISSLPAQMVEALAALSRFSQVLLCVHNPCQHYWGDIVADKDLLRHAYRRQLQRPASGVGHPLLAAWGKQGRDYINLLDRYDEPDAYRAHFSACGQRIDLFSAGDCSHLLGQLQDDILNLRSLAESRAQWPAVCPETDQSLRFHLAHSAQREVEILHDQLLARFAADPSLRPRDIIVMLPDIDSYAASIQAVFGQYERHDPRYIPFTLADQQARGQEPLLIALEHLLRLPDSRLGVSEVLDLLDVPALRARFAIAEADLATLQRWIRGAGIRWGLDARRRAERGLPEGLEQNTWRFGLRRMLLGYAVGQGQAYGEIEPYDEIGGLDAVLIGPLLQLLDTLDQLHQQLAQAQPASAWGQCLGQLLDNCFSAQDEHDQGLLLKLRQALEDWLELTAAVQLDEPLPLAVVREAWLGLLEQGKLGQRFLSGAVNFCTLMPMRAIPFRVVCLLGMNDGDYPRSTLRLDFDLMAGDYRPGDRSRREDDRYLLLEALLAAREQLYISWVGRSIRDNSERPPSVLIGQLRDHLQNAWRLDGSGELLDALTQEHPLQPFSRRYFNGSDAGLFSHAHEWAALYQPASAVTDDALPPSEQDTLSPEQLQAFLRDPVKYFFNQRLKVFLDEQRQDLSDDEPFLLNGLQQHQLHSHLLQAASQALEQGPQAVQQALAEQAAVLQRSGLLPLAGFGEQLREQLQARLPEQLARYQALCQAWPQPEDSARPLHLDVPPLSLQGWLSGLRGRSNDAQLARIELQAGGLARGKQWKWHRLLRPWVTHVLACAQGLPLHSLLVAEDVSLLAEPLPSDAARAQLHDWLQAWQQGLQQPLPVAINSAMAWLQADAPDKAQAAAQQAYEGGYQLTGECQQSACLARHYPDFAALTASGEFAGLATSLYQRLGSAFRVIDEHREEHP